MAMYDAPVEGDTIEFEDCEVVVLKPISETVYVVQDIEPDSNGNYKIWTFYGRPDRGDN